MRAAASDLHDKLRRWKFGDWRSTDQTDHSEDAVETGTLVGARIISVPHVGSSESRRASDSTSDIGEGLCFVASRIDHSQSALISWRNAAKQLSPRTLPLTSSPSLLSYLLVHTKRALDQTINLYIFEHFKYTSFTQRRTVKISASS